MSALLAFGPFLLRNWKLLIGGLALAVLGIMLASAKMDARHWRKKYENEHKRSAHLGALLDVKNAESLERNRAFEAAKERNAADVADANARHVATEARQARLKALAAQQAGKNCKAPESLLRELEGL